MKLVSIIGDSISTYEGFQPRGYDVFYDADMQAENGMRSVYDTWWARVNQALHAYLCINNSYSGSRVSGGGFPSAVSDERLQNLHDGECRADIILIYMGTNDFGYGVPIAGRGFRRRPGRDLSCFADAYDEMLRKVKANYPGARVICGTLMRSCLAGRPAWTFPEMMAGVPFEDYNAAIRRACRKQSCDLADLSALNLRYETLDGFHPTVRGHETMYRAWTACLAEMGLIEPCSTDIR